MSPLPCGLSRDHRPRYVSGTPRPYAGGRIWIGRFSSLPCARRNGRASASLTARGGGLPIGVNITSIGGVVSVPHLLPYTCAKFAAVGLSEGLRAELGQEGIHVTTVVPGLMRTGSYVQAHFQGQQEREFTWFALGATLPLL